MDLIKEFLQAWLNRIRNPVSGYFLISLMVINWKPLWFLIFSDVSEFAKFAYFDMRTSIYSLLILPAATAVLLAVVLPWIKLIGVYLVRKPSVLYAKLSYDSVHDLRIYQIIRGTEEAKARAEQEATIERAKIDAAKRLEEAKEVGGEELKEQILANRVQEPSFFPSIRDDLSDSSIDLLKYFGASRTGEFRLSDYNNNFSLEIDGQERKIKNRKLYLEVNDDVERLRRAGLLEKRESKVSKMGYDFLDWLDSPKQT